MTMQGLVTAHMSSTKPLNGPYNILGSRLHASAACKVPWRQTLDDLHARTLVLLVRGQDRKGRPVYDQADWARIIWVARRSSRSLPPGDCDSPPCIDLQRPSSHSNGICMQGSAAARWPAHLPCGRLRNGGRTRAIPDIVESYGVRCVVKSTGLIQNAFLSRCTSSVRARPASRNRPMAVQHSTQTLLGYSTT